MPEMRELMQRAATQPTTRPDVEILWQRGRSLRRRRQALNALVALGCVLMTGITALLITENDDAQTLDVVRGPGTSATLTTQAPSPIPSSTAPVAVTTVIPMATDGALHPIDQVVVVVMNGSRICGVATNYRPFIKANGYETVLSENAPNPFPTSVILFAEGFGADAIRLGTILNMPVTTSPDPQAVALLGRTGATVGVILGEDALRYVAAPQVCGGTGELGTTTTIRPTTVAPR